MPYEKKNTLCWSCENAVPNENGRGCTWSKRFIPVKGWTARPRLSGGIYEPRKARSYKVIECPEFIPGKEYKEVLRMEKEELMKKLEKTEELLQDCINELCYKCGEYRGEYPHLKCDVCKWEELKW